MTSAAPLSVVLSLLSQRKEGKRGRSVSHVKKGYAAYKAFNFSLETLEYAHLNHILLIIILFSFDFFNLNNGCVKMRVQYFFFSLKWILIGSNNPLGVSHWSRSATK